MHPFTTPEWVKHAVFYQIFPERFCNGDPSNDPENVQPWGTTPTPQNYMGGDLRGIISKLDYLQDLGITAIYLNPIFHAFSNHKYNTYNYFEIDPHFGDLAIFQELVQQVHQRGMYLILDGVFNHCGRGFFAFQSILEQTTASPYTNWFHLLQFPLHPYPPADSTSQDHKANYKCWWNIPSLPKFNTDHKPTRRYLLNIARYWLEQGIDGWRLDVPNEIDDHDFWREFRQVVKDVNPDAYIVGEIWKDANPWLDGTQFDAVMNYLFRDLCCDFFASETLRADQFAAGIDDLLAHYPPPATAGQLNLLGSHDTKRFSTKAGGDISRLYAAILFQMTYPGAPCIYYGDEVGMQGAEDPLCRGCFPWESANQNTHLYDWTRLCIRLRHAYPVLRTGSYTTLVASNVADTPVYGFARSNAEETLIVMLNPSSQPISCDIPPQPDLLPYHGSVTNILGNNGGRWDIQEHAIGQIQVPSRGGMVLAVTAA
jgi:glycosidase